MVKSKFLSWIIPTEKRFFDMLGVQADKTIEASIALKDLIKDSSNLKAEAARITEMEHEGDDIRHKMVEELNKSFITPIDREDINAISDLLDDILDFIEGTSTRMYLYGAVKIPTHMSELSEILLEAMKNVKSAIDDMAIGFKKFKTYHHRIHELENEGDEIQKNAIAEIFKSQDPFYVIKWKEIIETLESAIDKCEDAADIIDSVRMKFA